MRKMQFVLLLLLAAGQIACTMWGEKPVKTWSQATGGEHLERLFWQDLKAQNWDELERHMAPEYTLLTSTGPLDRTAALAYLRQLKIQDYSLSEFRVRPIGDGMIVTYTAVLRGTEGNEPLPSSPLQVMTVWHQAQRGWLATAHAEVSAKHTVIP